MSSACTNGIDIGFASLSYLQIGFLGIVQGITELLPISSTAHMRIVPALLGWQDPGSAFSAVMQLAALAAVISYFYSDVKGLVGGTCKAIQQHRFQTHEFRLAIGIVFATIPIGVAGLLLSSMLNACNSQFRGLQVIALSSVAMSILLAISELKCTHIRRIEDMRLRDALIIGIAQVGALVPGVSRSGATLTGALFLNFKREDAAQLSFLIGIPAIALAGMKELWVLVHAHISIDAWLHLTFGLVIGSISAFVAIWGLMRFLEKSSTWIFVAYRAALGLALIGALNVGWLA